MANVALRAGFAEVDITPAAHLDLAGMFHPRAIEGVHDPLFARAAVLEAGETRVALVSCDLLSLRRRTVSYARNEIARQCAIPPEHTAIFATHTHNGPYPATIFGREPDPEYIEKLNVSIAEAVRRAADALAPAELAVGSAYEGRISFNRRYVMKDGRVRTHPPLGSAEVAYAEGPKDPEVGVLCFRRPSGQVAGLLVNFACHPTVMGGTRKVSADYPGALARALKRVHGEQCVPLFGNGACGNICQVDVEDPEAPTGGPEVAARMGEVLAERATTAVRDVAGTAKITLAVAVQTVEIALRDPDTTPYHGTMFAGEPSGDIEAIYAAEQEELRRMLRDRPYETAEIQAVRIGPAALVMIPAELFVELGLEIKLNSPVKPTFVIEQANGTIGYVPTRHAFERGGYEVRTATSSRLAPEAGEQIVEAALETANG